MNLKGHREREVAAVILTHVRSVTLLSLHLLQLALRTRRTTQVRQATDNAQHSRQRDDGSVLTQGGVRADAEGDVGVEGPVEAHLVGLGEGLGIVVGAGEADEDLVAGVDADLTAVVVEDGAGLGLAVGAEGAVDADGFQAVAAELVFGFLGVFLGQAVDLGEVLLAFGGEEVVDDAGELPFC